jgi:hypothetical protein
LESGQWLSVMLKFADGITSWLEEHADQAVETLMSVSREAMNFSERELSVYAQAQLVVIYLERRDTDRARAHISLARAQVDGENAQAICDLREAQLYTHLNQAVPAMLERAVTYFREPSTVVSWQLRCFIWQTPTRRVVIFKPPRWL